MLRHAETFTPNARRHSRSAWRRRSGWKNCLRPSRSV
jgi:hypothetical protein